MTKMIILPRYAILSLLFGLCTVAAYGQRIAVKTNALYWATATPNIGLDLRLSRRVTLNVEGGIHKLNFSKMSSRWMGFTPEVRYWYSARPWAGHAIGLTALASDYRVGYRGKVHDGQAYGFGPTYTYAWVLRKRLTLEAQVGAGFMYVNERKYSDGREAPGYYNNKRWLFAPLKVGVNIVYLIR